MAIKEEVHHSGEDLARLNELGGAREDFELADGVEVRLADDLTNNVEDDLGDGVNDRLERVTDDDGDGELEGVALRDELLESLDHGDPFIAARAGICRGAPSGDCESAASYHLVHVSCCSGITGSAQCRACYS